MSTTSTYIAEHAAPPKPRTVFGREPAVVSGLIESVLTLLLAFGIGVQQNTFGPILAFLVAVIGFYVAWGTADTLLGACIGLIKAGIILGAVYGLSITDAQTAAIIMVTTVVISFFQRTQTSPLTVQGQVVPPEVVPVITPTGTGASAVVPTSTDSLTTPNGPESAS